MGGVFPSPQILGQLNLMPCRHTDFVHEESKLAHIAMIDSYWATNIVYNAYGASGEGYEVSYGQV